VSCAFGRMKPKWLMFSMDVAATKARPPSDRLTQEIGAPFYKPSSAFPPHWTESSRAPSD
jgi:hypothetical protein